MSFKTICSLKIDRLVHILPLLKTTTNHKLAFSQAQNSIKIKIFSPSDCIIVDFEF